MGEPVGFIGLGKMGGGMIRRLLTPGSRRSTSNTTAGKSLDTQSQGAYIGGDLREPAVSIIHVRPVAFELGGKSPQNRILECRP